MSRTDPTPEADGPHLDELATSAALDGEATPEELAHLDGCAACRAGVARLRAVQTRLVAAATEAPDPERRERAIAAALAASESPARVAPLAPALARSRRRRRRSADLAPWLGVAAVVLLIALAVPLLAGLGGSEDEDSAASGVEEASGSASDEGATVAPSQPVDVGDLGPLTADRDLRPVVEDALDAVDGGGEDGSAFAGDAPAAGVAGEAESEQEASDAAGGDDGDPVEDDRAGATATTAADGDGGTPQLAGRPAEVRAAQVAACEPTVRSTLADAGALLLTGTATVDGSPALVYGFAAPSDSATVLVALVAVDGCRTITVQAQERD